MQDSEMWNVAVGDCVRLSRRCPMDFEGAGPLPGADGRVVGLPRSTDPRRCVSVRFEGYACNWLVPRVYLE